MLWVEIVNRALDWDDDAGVDRLRDVWMLERGVDSMALRAAVAVVRAAATARLLDPTTALPAAASQWLAAVTLRAARPEERDGLLLPALRAARSGSRLPAALEELLSTALVELAATSGVVAARCAGVARATRPAADVAAEREFARRAGLDGLLVDGLSQCARLVAGPRHGQYCSKACSNAAFALRKSAREPSYFARKQARYRRAKQRPAARVESAFAFVD
jgi:hypothetical protein